MQQQAESIRGDDLRRLVKLERAAIDNWSRFTDGPDDLGAARAALLDVVAGEGVLRSEHPGWMTSPKPGIDAWLELPQGIVLSLVSYEDEPPRRWRATNALVHKRRPGRRAAQMREKPSRGQLDSAQIEELAGLGPEQISERVFLSYHCRERFELRAGGSPTELEQALVSASFEPRAPVWADAAGHAGPALVFNWGEDQFALPVVPNNGGHSSGFPYIATTCISKRLAYDGLLGRSGPQLAALVHISSEAARSWRRAFEKHELAIEIARARLTALIESEGVLVEELDGVAGPWILVAGGATRLRPLRAGEKRWVAQKFVRQPQ